MKVKIRTSSIRRRCKFFHFVHYCFYVDLLFHSIKKIVKVIEVGFDRYSWLDHEVDELFARLDLMESNSTDKKCTSTDSYRFFMFPGDSGHLQ